MAVRSVLDEFPQYAVLQVTPTAAAAGTVLQQLVTGLTNQQKIAWEVLRVEYALPADFIGDMVANADEMLLGITQSNNLVQDFSLRGQSMVDNLQLNLAMTAGPDYLLKCPIIHDFPKPRLVLPQMLFAFITWTLGGAPTVVPYVMRLWYIEHDVTKEDWYDLLQLRLPLGAQ